MRHLRIQLIFIVLVTTLTLPVAAVTKITLLSHYSPGFPHGQALTKYIEEYEALNPGTDIDFVFVVVDGFVDKIAVMAAAGTAPDIVHLAGYMLGDLAENRIIEPVPAAVASVVEKTFLPGAVDLVRYSGKLWGYPTEYMPRALAYHRGLLAQAGYPDVPPATWDDLKAYGRKLTKVDGSGQISQIGFAVTAATGPQVGWAQLFSFAYPLGGRFLSEDGKKATFTSEAVSRTLDFFQDLASSGAAVVKSWPIAPMKQEQVAMALASGPYWRTEFLNASQQVYDAMRSGPIPIPQAGMTPAHSAYGWLWSVSRTSKVKQEAYDFLTWLNTRVQDGQTRMGNVLANLGSIPVTPADLRTQRTIQEPFMQGFVEAVSKQRTFPEPVSPKILDMMTILERETRYALLGRESSMNTLIKAEQAIQPILNDVYR